MIKHWLLGLALTIASPWSARATPYTPGSDDEVLEKLSVQKVGRETMAKIRLRNELLSHPNDEETAVALAKILIREGKGNGDARLYGQAQAVLQPWWDLPKPSAAVKLEKAEILQHKHEFPAAQELLDQVLSAEPKNSKALLMMASVALVTGDFEKARKACGKLPTSSDKLLLRTCELAVKSRNHHLKESYQALQQELKASATQDPELKSWTGGWLAEMAMRMGELEKAGEFLKAALADAPNDLFLISELADLQISTHRYNETLTLLETYWNVDPLLLRYAEAAHLSQSARADESISLLSTRFAESWARGTPVHTREEALFNLHVLARPDRALELSLKNWQVQKEPIDADLVVQSAKLAKTNSDTTSQVAEVAKWARKYYPEIK